VRDNEQALLNNQANNNENDANTINIYANNSSQRRKGKYKYDREVLKQQVMALPKSKRRRYRHLAAATGIPLSTCHYLTKKFKIFKWITSSLKPKLTATNRHLRVLHALEQIDPTTAQRTMLIKVQEVSI
jgi:hypothetical protein